MMQKLPPFSFFCEVYHIPTLLALDILGVSTPHKFSPRVDEKPEKNLRLKRLFVTVKSLK